MTLELLQVLLIGSETVAGAQNKELCSVSKDLLAPPAPPPPTVLTPLRSPHPFQHTDNSLPTALCAASGRQQASRRRPPTRRPLFYFYHHSKELAFMPTPLCSAPPLFHGDVRG